jgi:hypothetical protein
MSVRKIRMNQTERKQCSEKRFLLLNAHTHTHAYTHHTPLTHTHTHTHTHRERERERERERLRLTQIYGCIKHHVLYLGPTHTHFCQRRHTLLSDIHTYSETSF